MTNEPAWRQTWASAFSELRRWRSLTALLERNLTRHGDAARWHAILAGLPLLPAGPVELGPTVGVGRGIEISAAQHAALHRALMALVPWRKGPFELYGVTIDAEWRSDWKWCRLAPHVAPLTDRLVLDVGCGNGYFGWRLLEAGARSVIGVDPTVLFVNQHHAVLHYVAVERPPLRNAVLPARLEDLPAGQGEFDTVMSMGVLYHRRDPLQHLAALHAHLRAGGELVLESLVALDESIDVLVPPQRYARMRNVWQIPSCSTLVRWLEATGFRSVRCVDSTPTTTDEQRSTAWMPLQSLADALDPADKLLTIEGLPAPVRSIVIAEK